MDLIYIHLGKFQINLDRFKCAMPQHGLQGIDIPRSLISTINQSAKVLDMVRIMLPFLYT